MRVAVVDDERDALALLEEYLADVPFVHTVDTFTHAEEALQTIRRTPYDLVLLDIQMPGMTGIQVASTLAESVHPPQLIFVTAHAEYALQAFDLHAIDYLVKPVSFDRFLNALQRTHKKHPIPAPTQQEPLELVCFGALTVQSSSHVFRFKTNKTEELFAYLWMHKERSIDRILDDVFAEFDEERAKQYLHTCVYQIRKMFKDVGWADDVTVTTDRKMYRLEIAQATDDLNAFQTAYDEALASDKIGVYLRAISIYRGEFLQQVNSTWVVVYRETYARMFEILLRHVIGRLLGESQTEIALYFARQLIDHFPLDSQNMQLLLQALLAEGLHEEARAAWKWFHAQWKSEFKEPLPSELLEWAEELHIPID